MSRPDPYGAAEPRGWDRPVPLPWPETDLESESWRRPGGPEAYAESPGRTRPGAGPYAVPWPDDDRYDAPRDRRPDEDHPGRAGREYRETDRDWRDQAGYRDDPGHPDRSRHEREDWDP